MTARNIVIMGAAGRDFHNFNCVFRDRDDVRVVAFTATQIPDIAGRRYPASLAGRRYPNGIPIIAESDLEQLCRTERVDEAVFSYSDVSHQYVMEQASRLIALGADFRLLGAAPTFLRSRHPVVAVCAVRTGSGKSQTTRRVAKILRELGKTPVIVRHPMPYGDLEAQRVQRFATLEDMRRHRCTIEEMEEYEPHITEGFVVYAGVDYAQILAQAEAEGDLILWDGGNNDLPFYAPDVHITVVDPHRPGHELTYYPGRVNLAMAHVIIINKIDTAEPEGIEAVRAGIRAVNPKAQVVDAASPIFVDRPAEIRGKRVLVVEDGPTLTHGEMRYGSGTVAAQKHGAGEIVDPRPYATGRIRETFEKYPRIAALLPAVGYGDEQVRDLEDTIRRVPCDLVIVATPVDLTRIVRIDKPMLRVRYELQEVGSPDLHQILKARLK
ncbi:MAG TPA: cyclic 2,3-diphosphoglycerate synthase [Spirochaetia bacterium]|nr:cyclic 2,3-diphosphoglycerate synthase [Spirochaetia bacterium]